VAGAEENLSRALTIGRDMLYYGEPDRINSAIERIEAVTVEQVNSVLRTYFTPERATVLLVRPAAAAEQGAP
jgi:predicted Zn-dependent peptidase